MDIKVGTSKLDPLTAGQWDALDKLSKPNQVMQQAKKLSQQPIGDKVSLKNTTTSKPIVEKPAVATHTPQQIKVSQEQAENIRKMQEIRELQRKSRAQWYGKNAEVVGTKEVAANARNHEIGEKMTAEWLEQHADKIKARRMAKKTRRLSNVFRKATPDKHGIYGNVGQHPNAAKNLKEAAEWKAREAKRLAAEKIRLQKVKENVTALKASVAASLKKGQETIKAAATTATNATTNATTNTATNATKGFWKSAAGKWTAAGAGLVAIGAALWAGLSGEKKAEDANKLNEAA